MYICLIDFFLLQLEFELDCLLSGRICCDPFVGNCSDREIHVCPQEFVQDHCFRHWEQNAPSVNGHYECPHLTFLCPSPIGKKTDIYYNLYVTRIV